MDVAAVCSSCALTVGSVVGWGDSACWEIQMGTSRYSMQAE